MDLADGLSTIGRQHQPQFFEFILGRAPHHLSVISRSHAQITAEPGAQPLLVKNLSLNPLFVDWHPMAKDGTCKLMPNQLIGFARKQERGDPIHFLALQVRALHGELVALTTPGTEEAEEDGAGAPEADFSWLPRPEDAREMEPNSIGSTNGEALKTTPLEPPSMEVTASAMPTVNAMAGATSILGPTSVLGATTILASASDEDAGYPGYPGQLQPIQERPREISEPGPKVYPQLVREATRSNAEIVLELHGSGVLDVPPQMRCIGPVSLASRPLFVGRRHQPDLLRECVARDCLQFLSREHFCISYEDDVYTVHSQTLNPIWCLDHGKAPLELGKGDAAELRDGDRIALGTGYGGAAVATALDAEKTFCCTFRIQPVLEEEVTTPPSPGGIGPRPSFGPHELPLSASAASAFSERPGSLAQGARAAVREERPSDLFGPDPRLLPAQRDRSALYPGVGVPRRDGRS